MPPEIQYANLHRSCDTENGEAIECGRKVNIGQPYGLASKMPTRRHAYTLLYIDIEHAALKEKPPPNASTITTPLHQCEDYSHASQRRQHEARPTPPASPAQTSRPAPKPAWREPLRRDHDLSTRMLGLLRQRRSPMPATGAVPEGLHGCAETEDGEEEYDQLPPHAAVSED